MVLAVDGPVREFHEAWLDVLTKDQQTLRFRLPRVKVMAPYIKFLAQGKMKESAGGPPPVVPGSRRLLQDKYVACRVPNLLGRDVFQANRLALRWDPYGESSIDTQEIVNQAALPRP